MGFICGFHSLPPLLVDIADNRLATLMDMDVFDDHLLIAFSAVLVQGFKLLGVEAH